MKLVELITTQRRDIKQPVKPTGDELGMGKYGVVHDDPKKFGVHKTASTMNGDGYFAYVDLIVRHELASRNPFFPRIYEINTTKTGDIRQYRMEKLVPGPSLDPMVIHSLGERYLKSFTPMVDHFKIPDDSQRMWNLICNELNSALEDGDMESISDDRLLEALEIIYHELISKRGFDSDLGHKNAMIRITGAGPQLVITDPIE